VVEVVASVYDVEIWNVCVMRVCVLGIFRLDHEKLKSVALNSETFIYHKRKILVRNTKVGCRYNFFLCSRKFFVAQQNFLDRKIILAIRNK